MHEQCLDFLIVHHPGRGASTQKDTWIFDDQMLVHPIIIQSSGLWHDMQDGLDRHSAKGGAATGQSQVAVIRCSTVAGQRTGSVGELEGKEDGQ